MNKKITCLSAFLMTFLLGQPVFAESMMQSTNGQMAMHQDKDHQDKMLNKLNLSDEQKTKINAIRTKMRDQFETNRVKMRNIQMQIGALVDSDKMDEKKLDDLISQRSQLMSAMMKNVALARNQIFNILTPEQKTKIAEMKQQWMEKHKQKGM